VALSEIPLMPTIKEPYIPSKRALYVVERALYMRILLKCGSLQNSSDACDKRALYTLQKSPIYPPKEPYIPSKRALYALQKSPIYPPKEPYIPSKRALYTLQKSPVYENATQVRLSPKFL